MWPFNRCIVRRSWALSQHNPDLIASKALEKDEKAGKEPVHGEKFVYEESHETGSKLGALLLTGSIMLFGVLFFGSRLVSEFCRGLTLTKRLDGLCSSFYLVLVKAKIWKS